MMSTEPASEATAGVAPKSKSRWAPSLTAYFCSGWAFLIPYLIFYLIYAWRKWPVNPTSTFSAQLSVLQPPSLLQVYWILHGMHLIMGTLALRSHWAEQTGHPTRKAFDLYRPVLTWLLLALLFWIPGVYLEYPSDPWQHYARINEWSFREIVTQHSTWTKFSYFFANSMIGHIAPALLQLKWFNAYYTGCCLLLCWQYYRLGRAVGLGERGSFIFVLIQVLASGNNIFGFYRYYGMSSSLFAQIGAVALVRFALVLLRQRPENGCGGPQAIPAMGVQVPGFYSGAGAVALLALTAFNHVQGLGIAGLGIAAVVIWRLIAWRRSMAVWLVFGIVLASFAAVLWWPRNPNLDTVYRPEGWLAAWYGFNIFAPFSIAGDRTLQILGLFGLLNLGAGVALIRRNHVVGWLTVVPIIALCLPIVAIPFANTLARTEAANIVAFHRVFLGIPAGLAVVLLCRRRFVEPCSPASNPAINPGFAQASWSFYAILLALAAIMMVPSGGPSYNRTWNALMIVPDDLSLRQILEETNGTPDREKASQVRPNLLTAAGIGYAAHAAGYWEMNDYFANRYVFPRNVPANLTSFLFDRIVDASKATGPTWLLIPSPTSLETPRSTAGYLSRHWSPQQVALDYMAAPELSVAAEHWGGKIRRQSMTTYYFFSGPGR